jgi:hypothetical protein
VVRRTGEGGDMKSLRREANLVLSAKLSLGEVQDKRHLAVLGWLDELYRLRVRSL